MFHNDWDEVLKDELQKDYFKNLLNEVNNLYKEKIIYPPKKDVFKRYLAHVSGELAEESVKQLEVGVEILDGNNDAFITKPAKIKVLGAVDDLTAVEICITEGKFHQVKRMFASVGCKVMYLKRLAIGALELDESLALGEYRELTEEELALLKDETTH